MAGVSVSADAPVVAHAQATLVIRDSELSLDTGTKGGAVWCDGCTLVRLDPLPDQQVWVSYPRLQHQSPKTRALVDYLTEILTPRGG